ncbi:MAG: hypothetical protein ACYTG0_27365 [Planctomycetota bacterium]
MPSSRFRAASSWTLALAVLTVGASCRREEAPQPPPAPAKAPPEGSTDVKALVGGDAESDAAAATDHYPEYPLQENPLAGCSLCHVDVEDKFVGSIHFEEKVGCATCHGPSEGHLADENNEVKPDEVFARDDVDRLCGGCHECFRLESDQPEVTAEGQPKVCTDCHGHHDVALLAEGDP